MQCNRGSGWSGERKTLTDNGRGLDYTHSIIFSSFRDDVTMIRFDVNVSGGYA